MKCLNCGIELEQKGNRKKEFCDDKCRMAYKRSNPNIESEQIQSEHPEINSEQSNPNNDKKEDIVARIEIGKYKETLKEIKDLNDDELQDNIKMYPQDTWKDSPEFAEVLRRKNKKN